MTPTGQSPVYRQRLTLPGVLGVISLICAPIAYALIWSSWTASDAWLIVPALLAVIGPVLILIGREYYDPNSPEEVAARAVAAERIRQQKIRR